MKARTKRNLYKEMGDQPLIIYLMMSTLVISSLISYLFFYDVIYIIAISDIPNNVYEITLILSYAFMGLLFLMMFALCILFLDWHDKHRKYSKK